MSRKKKEELYDDSWLYTLLLISFVILGESLKTYMFPALGLSVTFSIFVLPIMFLLQNFITKKYGFDKTVLAIFASMFSTAAFAYLISTVLGNRIDILELAGEMAGYTAAGLINLNIYVFLLNNADYKLPLVWLSYVFSLVIMYLFYTLINMNILITDSYWKGYFVCIFIQSIECIFITLIDSRIHKGLVKEK